LRIGGVALGRRQRTHAISAAAFHLAPAEIAWLALAPAALVLIALILLLGPLLARALLAPPAPTVFWPAFVTSHVVHPEPTEHARYVLALLGPLLLSVVIAAARQASRSSATVLTERISRTLLAAFVGLCVLVPHAFTYGSSYGSVPFRRVYFTWATLALALVVAAVIAVVLHSSAASARLARLARETAAKRILAVVAALLFGATWLLSAFNTEGTIGNVNGGVLSNVVFWIDEPMSVLNGQAPLVDFNAQYGHLWSYLVAAPMYVFGTSYGVYATVMAIGTAASLIAVYATLRRLSRSSLVTLALFLPLAAHGFFIEFGPLANRYGPANLYSLFPIRYAGPYLLAWMVVRHLDGARPRGRWLLFVTAGLVAINNLEFGVPALGATVAAVIWADRRRSLPRISRVLGEMLLGVVGAAAIVSSLTLVVAGSLPHFGMLLRFPRVYGVDGFGMMPMPPLGMHLVLYVTFAAAIVVATVRTVTHNADRALTGMLAWSGVFGLGASSYYAGRSHPDVLIDLFSAWAFALVLLLLVSVRAIVRRGRRWPTAAELAVLFGFGVMVCSLAQTPSPWAQLTRLGQPTAEPLIIRNAAERFVAANTRRGEAVAILIKLGHRIAYDVGVRNVAPYANFESMLTQAQWSEMLRALRAAHGRKLFVPIDQLLPEELDAVSAAGFLIRREDRTANAIELIDSRSSDGGAADS
jgi:hypothetical protein